MSFQWPQGSSGLSLFFVKVRDEEGKLNSIQVQRLKDKLGTRQMATAELWLDGAKAELVRKVSPSSWAGPAWHGTPLMGVWQWYQLKKFLSSTSVAVHRTLPQQGCVWDRAEKSSGKDRRKD